MFILLSSFFPLVSLPTEQEGFFNSFPPLSSKVDSGGIGSSEEEKIDSWDVHPESLRWNTTLDDSIVDRITDSQFENLVVQNETSGSSGYEMNRGTVKTDGKFEWRMKSEGSGNQTEYFRDVLGDECDFTEGDTEGWTSLTDMTVENGILRGDASGFDQMVFVLSISAEVYSTVSFKVKGNISQSTCWVLDDDFEGKNWDLTTEWQIITLDMSTQSTWEREEVIIRIGKSAFDPTRLYFDWIKLIGDYDFATHIEGAREDTFDFEEENDTEGIATFRNSIRENVSDGIITIESNTSVSYLDFWWTSTDLTGEFFDTVKIRMNVSDISDAVDIELWDGSAQLGETSISSTNWVEYTFTDFSSTETTFMFRIIPDAGTFDLVWNIDYVLLLGKFNPSDSVIGLMDSVGNPLLNISTHFYGNNTGRMEFELLDATGELSYHWYSDLYSDLDEIFIIGKCSFDVLRSRLEITITSENNSRIDKITFPNEFILDSGLIPPLFSNEMAPYIFYSSYTIDHSWQKVFIDWIKCDFKERQWINTDIPTDPQWLTNTPLGAQIVDTVENEISQFKLNVPNLDSVSGILTSNTTDNIALNELWEDELFVSFVVYGVDGDDGEHHELIKIRTKQSTIAANQSVSSISIFVDGNLLFAETIAPAEASEVHPKVAFSISVSDDRENLTIMARAWLRADNEDDFFDIVGSCNARDIVDDLSQEFVISTIFSGRLYGDVTAFMLVEDFGFVSNDIFSDIAKHFVEPIGNFLQQIFINLFKFIADIFRSVGDALGVVFTTVGTAITSALTTLQTALGTAIGLVETAIGTLKTALETAIGLVETAIGVLKTALETAIGLVETAIGTLQTALETAMGLVETAIGVLETAIETVIGTLQDAFETAIALVQDAVEGVFVFLIAAMADIIDEIITVVLSVISDIIDIAVGIVFFLWDALGLPDLLAVVDLFLVAFVELVNAIPAFIVQVIPRILAIWGLFAVLGIFIFLILPALASESVGEFFEKFIHYFFTDITAGASFLGFSIPVPAGFLWLVTVIYYVLGSTIYGGFFT